MSQNNQVRQNLQHIQQRIETQLKKSGRTDDIAHLLAVSKKHPSSAIQAAYTAGQRDFGENYLQEALHKINVLKGNDIVWHFIGPIQSNKTKPIAEHFHWAHSVDRSKIAQRISDQRPSSLPPINLCIQVNIDDEPSKSGISSHDTIALAEYCTSLPRARLRGLMCIPSPEDNKHGQSFAKLHSLFNEVAEQIKPPYWDTLSMGMSADLELAIDHGATIVRIGTDIFGPRQ